MDFSVITTAGVTQGELAYLCKTSRTTANKWLMGRSAPHTFVHARVVKVLSAVGALLESKKLPAESGEHRVHLDGQHYAIRPAVIKLIVEQTKVAS